MDLDEIAKGAEIALDATQRAQLIGHLEAVLEAARSQNLTAIRTREDAMRLHVLDSLMSNEALGLAPAGRLLDLGSGAGYPGIPLAVVSGRAVVLLEATKRKCLFLEQCVRNLGVEATVLCSRAEEAALDSTMSESFAVVTARAVAELPVLLELATPFLIPGGILVAMKGRISAEEIERGDAAGALLGMHRTALETYVLPGGDDERSLVVCERSGTARVRIPRRPGMAKKRPLA